MVSLVTDMSVPKDVTHIRVKVKRDSEVREERDFFVAPDGEFFLPGTIAVIEGSTPAPVVSVEVIGIRTPGSGTPEARTFSKVTTTIPRERIALLRVPVQWLCDETAVDDGTGSYATSCPPIAGEEAACVAGRCQLVEVDSSTLPDFEPRDIFGGGESAQDPLARCFDTLDCFDRGVDVDPDDLDEDCTLELDDNDEASYNVALRLGEGEAGICHGTGQAAPCYVPLDQDDLWGWRFEADPPDGKVRLALPPAVCDRVDDGRIEAVRVTTVCETKTARYPTCGPWSEVTEGNSGEGGASGESGSGGTTATSSGGGSGGSTESGSVGGSGGNTATDNGGGTGGSTATSSGGTGGTGQFSECQDPLVFADPIVEAEVRVQASVATDPLSAAAVAGITALSLDAPTDLDGIQCLPSLMNVALFGSVNPNLEPLAGVTRLALLTIQDAEVPDLSPLGSLTSLSALGLSGNGISDVAALESLTNLTSLDLSLNSISDITALGALTNLEDLRLISNDVSDITALASLNKLTNLSLTSNNLSEVTDLGSLSMLFSLDLRDNNLSDITGIGSPPRLSFLDLSENDISDVSGLATLTNLAIVVLSTNNLSDLDALVANSFIGADDTLYLTGNPFDCEEQSANIIELVERGVTLYSDCP